MVNKHTGKFNLIAPLYGLAFNYQVNYYTKLLARVADEFNFSQHQTVLDIGCGTGALCHVLANQGLQVTGVDAAEKMIAVAGKYLIDKPVKLCVADVLHGLPFAYKSFDLVTAFYVLHGLSEKNRNNFYNEINRIAKSQVIIHDYNEKRSPITDLIEWAEGGNYFDFIKHSEKELLDNFASVYTIKTSPKTKWHICQPVR